MCHMQSVVVDLFSYTLCLSNEFGEKEAGKGYHFSKFLFADVRPLDSRSVTGAFLSQTARNSELAY